MHSIVLLDEYSNTPFYYNNCQSTCFFVIIRNIYTAMNKQSLILSQFFSFYFWYGFIGKSLAAHVEGADPFRCNSSNRQTPPNSAKLPQLWKQQCDWDVILDLECPEPVWPSLCCDWKSYFKLFGRGSFLKCWEEKDGSVNESVTEVFVEQSLALPGSA